MRAGLSALVAVAVLVACEAPPVFPGADKRQSTHSARIEGRVLVSSAARGDVIVFLYDAAKPPPPAGTGRPLSFTVVPREAVFGSAPAGELGPFTAPFAFSLVAPGRYLLRGFVDANADFIPWYGVTADVNAGDVGGAAVDPVTHLPRVIEVAQQDDLPVATVGVPVTFSDAARVPVDRPVFELADGGTSVTLAGAPQVLELRARPIDEGAVHEAQPRFLVRLLDENNDGVPDDSDGDGAPDLWPRVVVRKLAEGASPLTDETGVDYEHVSPSTGATLPADGTPDVVVLAAGFDVTGLLPLLVDALGHPKPTPTPVTSLRLVVKPRALDASNPLRPGVLEGVPPGRYAITVIQSTGQTWRVPNELSPPLAAQTGLPSVESQSATIRVP